jgi:hypothetical protein
MPVLAIQGGCACLGSVLVAVFALLTRDGDGITIKMHLVILIPGNTGKLVAESLPLVVA